MQPWFGAPRDTAAACSRHAGLAQALRNRLLARLSTWTRTACLAAESAQRTRTLVAGTNA